MVFDLAHDAVVARTLDQCARDADPSAKPAASFASTNSATKER